MDLKADKWKNIYANCAKPSAFSGLNIRYTREFGLFGRVVIQGEFISMLYSRALILRNYCNKDINIFCLIYYLDFAIFTGTHYLTIYSQLWAQFTHFLSPPLFPSCLDTSLYLQPITASSAWIMKQCSKATVPSRFHELDNWQMVC